MSSPYPWPAGGSYLIRPQITVIVFLFHFQPCSLPAFSHGLPAFFVADLCLKKLLATVGASRVPVAPREVGQRGQASCTRPPCSTRASVPWGASLFPTCLQPCMARPWKPTFSALFWNTGDDVSSEDDRVENNHCSFNLSGCCCESLISEGAAAPEGKFSCRSLWRNLHQSNRGYGPWHLHFPRLLWWQKRVEGSNLSHFCLKIFSLSDVKISVDLWQDQRL